MTEEPKVDDYRGKKQGRHLSDAALNLREAGFAYPVSLPLSTPATAAAGAFAPRQSAFPVAIRRSHRVNPTLKSFLTLFHDRFLLSREP